MSASLRIAWRYLFAKKGHNAINIVSGVSAAGVCVVTAAMVIVLSVMNGFSMLVEKMFSAFDPDIRITATTGKSFNTDTDSFEKLRTLANIAVFSESIEETALIEFSDKQVPVMLKGVDENFTELTNIDSIITDGTFSVTDWFDDGSGQPTRAFERCVLGIGLSNQINIGAHFVSGIKIYAPKREGKINTLRPDKSFNRASAFISGIFAVNQSKYDDNYMLVSLPLARELFDYSDTQATAVELRLKDTKNISRTKKEITALLGDGFKVEDRYQQQQDFFRIMQIEKVLTAILLIFILLIASFNIVGSLSMLMIDKQNDTEVLRSLGADDTMLKRIFLYEGWLISLVGAAIGLVLGVLISLGQQHFGWLKLGTGIEYIIEAYPVQVQAIDILIVCISVLLLGWLAAWIPSRQVVRHQNNKSSF